MPSDYFCSTAPHLRHYSDARVENTIDEWISSQLNGLDGYWMKMRRTERSVSKIGSFDRMTLAVFGFL